MLAITRKRQIRSVGCNVEGQLDLGDYERRSKLTMACVFYSHASPSFVTNTCVYKKKIETFRSNGMLHVSAGALQSVCSDADGCFFAFGRVHCDSAEPDGICWNTPKPIKVCSDDEEMPTTMSCDYFNTCVSTNKGNLCFWGVSHEAKKIAFDDPNIFVKSVSAGFHHTAVIAVHNVVD